VVRVPGVATVPLRHHRGRHRDWLKSQGKHHGQPGHDRASKGTCQPAREAHGCNLSSSGPIEKRGGESRPDRNRTHPDVQGRLTAT
jgi:hypothetical protein